MKRPPADQGPPETWELVEPLGEGGAGTVWRARFVGAGDFGRTVAVKMLTHVRGDRDALLRLQREASHLARVRHRAVVRVDRLVQIDDQWALVMELVPGVGLDRVLRAGPLPPRAALEVVEELAGALDAATSTRGPAGTPLELVHCDIKPSNIQLTPHGEARLLDFGIARFRGDHSGTISGTPAYMSPERWRGVIAPACDIYALGCVLFELLVGEPFGRCSLRPGAHAERVVSAADHLLDGGLPGELVDLWQGMVAEAPERRPSARDLAARADALVHTLPGSSLRTWAPEVVAGQSTPLAAPPAPRSVRLTASWWLDTPPDGSEPTRANPTPPSAPSGTSRLSAMVGAGVLFMLAWAGWSWTAPGSAPHPTRPEEPALAPSPAPTSAPAPIAAPASAPPAPAPVAAPIPSAARPPPPSESPEAAPLPAAPPAPPPHAPATVQVQVTGSAARALVDSKGERAIPGPVPPGRYTVRAQFPGLGTMPAGTVTIGPSETTVVCDDDLALCWTEP